MDEQTQRETNDAPPAGEAPDAPVRRTPPGLAPMQVRESDLEPYVGLRYLSKLFRLMALILALVLVAEVIAGLIQAGRAAIPALLAEASRLIVLAGLLWGAGDLAILLIDIGHDVRATRIMLGRQIAQHGAAPLTPADDEHRDAPADREPALTPRER
jgi:hypothetical protein